MPFKSDTFKFWIIASLGLTVVSMPALSSETTTHALSLMAPPKYGPDATHLEWVNPNAPKGGSYTQAIRGTFDNLHAFAQKGNAAGGLGLTIETLMSTHSGETSVEYPSIAESVTVADDLSYTRFDLNPAARFHDGTPITVEDVLFSFEILTSDQAPPVYRSYYTDVAKAEQTADRQVTFTFSGPPNRELPNIIGQLPVLSKAYWAGKEFSETVRDAAPLGSGPYRVKAFEMGRYIEYERINDWWAADLLVNKGQYNFDTIRYEYFLDDNAKRLAFQKGQSDLHVEATALQWATGYDFPAVKDGRVIKAEIPDRAPQGMQAFVFNTRRPQFADRRVRQALGLAFDFEWTNRERFFSAYTRTTSFFQSSDFASSGIPEGDELALLEPFRDQLPPELFTDVFTVPVTDGTGRNRKQLRQAKQLLADAGWTVGTDKILRNTAGEALTFEVMLISPAFERIVDPFLQNLEKLGVKATMVTLQQPEYVARMRSFDFDMMVSSWRQSNSLGNEQRDMWSSAAADQADSRNLAGIKDPAVDALIETIVAAKTRDELIVAGRALDRVLLWGHYVIPQWHVPLFRVAYWDKFGRPEKTPAYNIGVFSWWIDPEKDARITESLN